MGVPSRSPAQKRHRSAQAQAREQFISEKDRPIKSLTARQIIMEKSRRGSNDDPEGAQSGGHQSAGGGGSSSNGNGNNQGSGDTNGRNGGSGGTSGSTGSGSGGSTSGSSNMHGLNSSTNMLTPYPSSTSPSPTTGPDHSDPDASHSHPPQMTSLVPSSSLNTLSVTSSSNSGSASPSLESNSSAMLSKSSTNAGAIAGGILGGIAFIALVNLIVILWLRRRKRKQTPASAEFRSEPYTYGRITPVVGSGANGRGLPAQRFGGSSTSTPMPGAWMQFRDMEAGGVGSGAIVQQKDGDEMREVGGGGRSEEDRSIASFSVSSTGANESGNDAPPQWTTGTLSDPLYEKMAQARQANVDYGLSR